MEHGVPFGEHVESNVTELSMLTTNTQKSNKTAKELNKQHKSHIAVLVASTGSCCQLQSPESRFAPSWRHM